MWSVKEHGSDFQFLLFIIYLSSFLSQCRPFGHAPKS